jgi:hypothetical protein
MRKVVEDAAKALLFLCTAMLLVVLVSRVVVAFSIRTLFVGAVVSGRCGTCWTRSPCSERFVVARPTGFTVDRRHPR